MIWLIPTTPNLMGKTGFLLPLMVVVLLPTFGTTLSAYLTNITTDQLAILALKSNFILDPQNLLATWSISTSVCSWVGVTCGSRHHRVTALNFSGMGITGTIPPHLGNLSFLAWLDISNNSFHGSLPFELVNLQRLKYLNFANNSFGGEIPSWFGSFAKLQSLFLQRNNLTGFIPPTLGNLSKLEMLSLYINHFEGQIPVALGNLSNLKYLYLDQNRLSGNIPSGIFDQLPKLKQLYLDSNLQISGRIPNGLFKCKELEILYLSNNSLEGNVPIEIGNLTMLNTLFLSWNDLEGPIPSSIFNLSSLDEVALGNNKLSARDLSSDMFDYLPRLRYLELSESQLSGRIPTSLFKCKKLEYIFFIDNQLEGTVPLEVANLTSLKEFFIGGNNFVGRIPSLPPSLLCVDLGGNNLDGEIPSSICNLSSLKALDLSGNNLGGIILECLGNLSLLHMYLHVNNFHGKLSETLFPQSCLLRSFHINSNQLEGPIPQSLVNCKDLEALDLGRNKLNDTFPTWLATLKNLQILDLRSNRFYGHIANPEVESSFAHLRIIDLSNNDFGGCLPMMFFKNLHAIINGSKKKGEAEYMRFDSPNFRVYYEESLSITLKGLERQFTKIITTLTVVDFSNNRFTGQIPEIIGDLHSLIVLNLSHNSLKGPIPSSLGNLSVLESFDLSSNKLQGSIPVQLVNLNFLQVLNLSCNNLTGLIPRGNHFDTFTNDSYYGNLGLCGFPLSKCCVNDKGVEPRPIKFDETIRELNWKYSILMGYGCGVVFGLSMGYIVFKTGKPWWFVQIIQRVQQKCVGRKICRTRGGK